MDWEQKAQDYAWIRRQSRVLNGHAETDQMQLAITIAYATGVADHADWCQEQVDKEIQCPE